MVSSEFRQPNYNSLISLSSKAIRVGQFMMLNLPTLIGSKIEEDPQGFVDEIVKIVKVMHAIVVKGMEFTACQLMDIAYQWYEEWEQ